MLLVLMTNDHVDDTERYLLFVQGNSIDFEAEVVAQCDALMEAIKHRKQELLASVGHERDLKVRVLKDQVSQCTGLLQRTTGLLHFCIEVLKESDSASFLQVRFKCLKMIGSNNASCNIWPWIQIKMKNFTQVFQISME